MITPVKTAHENATALPEETPVLNHKFTHPIEIGEDPQTGLPVFGFSINDMFISEPKLSECGRFDVDPLQAYGLTPEDVAAQAALNAAIKQATEDALNAGCLAIQQATGIPSGDVAGLYFSDEAKVRPIAEAMAKYLETERTFACQREVCQDDKDAPSKRQNADRP